MRWRVENLRQAPLAIAAARLPHGKFRSDEREFIPAVDLQPDGAAEIEAEVRCDEPPGAVVENAFLILRVVFTELPWLVLARLRVLVDEDGKPAAVTELITTQPVGFALRQTVH